jgi:hypothetical protein
MKSAAILALVLALAFGAWAINDYRNNEEVRRDFARQGVSYLDFRTDAGETVHLDVRKMSTYYERRDTEVGALSVAFLIGAIFLFWRRFKAVDAVDSN